MNHLNRHSITTGVFWCQQFSKIHCLLEKCEDFIYYCKHLFLPFIYIHVFASSVNKHVQFHPHYQLFLFLLICLYILTINNQNILFKFVPVHSSTEGLVLPADQLKGELQFCDVSFAYPTRKEALIFQNLSLLVPAGTIMAVVGSSGSGKSTLVSLLLRLYDSDEGENNSSFSYCSVISWLKI